MTVSPGLVNEYNKEFKISAELIRSVPYFVDCLPLEVLDNKIRMVHHGGANRNRTLEKMIEVAGQLDDRFSLDFYLVGDAKYIKQLKSQAAPYKNIMFKVPMAYEDIVLTLNRYDLGFFLVQPTTFNLRYCLPNKIFEFIQARLMVAIGPSPDMAALVNEHECGIVADSFKPSEMAKKLNELTVADIMKYKHNSDIAAKVLCFEQEGKKLQKIISACCTRN